ncbi:MAG: hypothetical protein ACREOW_07410 [Thermodesulfobacteriota bacterium]
MKGKPDWLPDIVSVDGEWNEVVSKLYSIFDKDFKQPKPTFKGKEIWWDMRKLERSVYEEAFWHLITKQDRVTGERLLDARRAERLSWCVPIICNAHDEVVKVWDFREANGRLHTYLWLESFDYVVVLQKRAMRFKEVYFLITAFHVDGASRRRSLQAKYEKREV